jgi:hypothetical protein
MLALICALLAYLLQMSAWAVIMRALAAPLRASEVWQGYLLAFLPRYIPGTVWGYLSRNEWLAQHKGVSYATSSLASLLEVTTLLLTAFVYGSCLWVEPRFVGLVWLAAVPALWLNWHYVPHLARRINAGRWSAAIGHAPSLRLGLLGNGLYLGFWAAHGAGVFLLGQAFTPLPLAELAPTLACASLAWAVGFLVLFVPAGLGVREATLVTLLTQFTTLPVGVATTVALLSRLTTILAEFLLLVGGITGHVRERFVRPPDGKIDRGFGG